jgi:hypothetical protein
VILGGKNMAHVVVENNLVVGVFARPQPHLDGYQEIADGDQRIIDFYQRQSGV